MLAASSKSLQSAHQMQGFRTQRTGLSAKWPMPGPAEGRVRCLSFGEADLVSAWEVLMNCKGVCLLAGEAGQPLSEDSSGKHSRHSSMPILSKIRSSITRRLSSGKEAPKMTAAAQQAVAAY